MSWCFEHWSERMEKLRVVLAYKREDGAMPWGLAWLPFPCSRTSVWSVWRDLKAIFKGFFRFNFQGPLIVTFIHPTLSYIHWEITMDMAISRTMWPVLPMQPIATVGMDPLLDLDTTYTLQIMPVTITTITSVAPVTTIVTVTITSGSETTISVPVM